MLSPKLVKLLFLVVLPITYNLSPITYSYAQETLTITTYYPSPFGNYQELRAQRIAVGTTWVNPANFPWHTPWNSGDVCAANEICNADLVVEGSVGIGTRSPEFKLSLDNDGGIIAKGTYGSGKILTTTGLGTRLIWYPVKGAFRAGYVDADQWDNGSIGPFSFAGGSDTKATWDSSFAMGASSISSGAGSSAMGVSCNASQQGSFAIGMFSTASNVSAMALGGNNTASGYAALATGYEATASGNYSTAIGQRTTASGLNSLAIGKDVTAGVDNNITFGQGFDSSNRLVNNTANSLMIGFNSTVPTLFIGPSSGIGTTGRVGIGTSNPATKLEVSGGAIKATGGLIIELRTSDPASPATGRIWLRTDL